MPGLSFITLLAYDYRYAPGAINSYYDIADEILLGLDADRISWSGNRFDLDMAWLESAIARLDSAGKIRIVQGNFHTLPQPMANDTAERDSLSRLCREGNWVVQIDADEVLLNAGEFRQWMTSAPPGNLIMARWLVAWKMLDEYALVVDPPSEYPPVATMLRGRFRDARYTRQEGLLSPLVLLHDWGRSGTELLTKMRNWSHSRDFDVENYFRMWEQVTLENYHLVRDFHPTHPALWHSLKAVPLPKTASADRL